MKTRLDVIMKKREKEEKRQNALKNLDYVIDNVEEYFESLRIESEEHKRADLHPIEEVLRNQHELATSIKFIIENME